MRGEPVCVPARGTGEVARVELLPQRATAADMTATSIQVEVRLTAPTTQIYDSGFAGDRGGSVVSANSHSLAKEMLLSSCEGKRS